MTNPVGGVGTSAGATQAIGGIIDAQYNLGNNLNFDPTKSEEMQTLVYSPDVRVWIARGGKQYDVSEDIVGGSILRKEDSASSLVIRLANKDNRYNGLFHRMDRITCFLKRVKWIQVFSGYLDSVPLYHVKPGVATLRATCTIKRIMHTWWDPGLEESQALLASQWDISNQDSPDGQGSADSGIGGLLARVLIEVGGWDPKNLHIQEIPTSFADFLSSALGKMSENNKKAADQFRRLLLGAGDTSGGIGSSAARSQNVTSGTKLLGKENYIAAIIAATDERRMGPITRDVSVGQDIRRAGEEGIASNATDLDGVNDDATAWDNIRGIGSGYEEDAKDSDAAILAVATALVESNLQMYANTGVPESLNFPHDAIGQDHDSVGLFQQRSAGWGTIEQRMDARASAGMFLNALNKFDWRNMDPGEACATVQQPRSDLRYKYGQRMSEAAEIVHAARAGQTGTGAAPIPQAITTIGAAAGAVVPGSGTTQTPSGIGEIAGSAVGKPVPDSEGAVQYGYLQLGKPYIWGARGPHGFDCSGFTQQCYRAIGLDIGANTYEQIKNGTSVSPSQIQRGDLIFPHTGHVVIWLGDGTIMHSPQSGDVVKIAPIYFDLNGVAGIRNYAENGGAGAGAPFTDPQISGPGLPPATGVGIGNSAGVAVQGGSTEPIARNLFSYMFEHQKFQSKISNMFEGEKAYINDEPLIQIIQTLVKSGLRSFSSAPNGDFAAWFPDYFGIDGKQAILNLEEIEMIDVGIDFNDDSLTTHVYIAGDNQYGQGIPVNELGWLESHGVASVENKFLFGLLTAMSIGFPEQMDGPELMRRFGVRPLRQEFTSIASKELEFFVACQIFMKKWAEQFATQVQFTFMPELFPGMRINLVGHNMQVYVTEVNHTFDFEDGFTTSATIMAPSNPNFSNVPDRLGYIYRNFMDNGPGGFGGVLTEFRDE